MRDLLVHFARLIEKDEDSKRQLEEKDNVIKEKDAMIKRLSASNKLVLTGPVFEMVKEELKKTLDDGLNSNDGESCVKSIIT